MNEDEMNSFVSLVLQDVLLFGNETDKRLNCSNGTIAIVLHFVSFQQRNSCLEKLN